MRAIFHASTCFVVPSLYEPAGVVFAGAAAAVLPSIGGTPGGCADFIGDGGVVIDPCDDDALFPAMLAYADGATAARVGRRAADGSPLFTWPAVAGRLVAALGLKGVSARSMAPLPLRSGTAGAPSGITLPAEVGTYR